MDLTPRPPSLERKGEIKRRLMNDVASTGLNLLVSFPGDKEHRFSEGRDSVMEEG